MRFGFGSIADLNGHMSAGYSWQIRGDRESLEYFSVGEKRDLRTDKLTDILLSFFFLNETVWDFKTTISFENYKRPSTGFRLERVINIVQKHTTN